eukprot:5174412-Amphidinium_carterae.1
METLRVCTCQNLPYKLRVVAIRLLKGVPQSHLNFGVTGKCANGSQGAPPARVMFQSCTVRLMSRLMSCSPDHSDKCRTGEPSMFPKRAQELRHIS